jgi:hypothetical protein
MTFNTSIIIEEIIIKKDGEEIPFEWGYIYDNASESVKTKELQLTVLKIKDTIEYDNKADISDLAVLDFLALKGYIIPTQPLGTNPRIIFDNVPALIASKLLRVYAENFLVGTNLELKIKKQ